MDGGIQALPSNRPFPREGAPPPKGDYSSRDIGQTWPRIPAPDGNMQERQPVR